MPLDEGRDFSLVPAVDIGVEQADRDRLDSMVSGSPPPGTPVCPSSSSGCDLRTVVAQPARNLEAQGARNDRLGEPDRQIEEIVAALLGDLQQVAEAARDEHRCLHALSLDDCVGDERRAMDDRVEVGKAQPRRFRQT